jgi:hypothetical protein
MRMRLSQAGPDWGNKTFSAAITFTRAFKGAGISSGDRRETVRRPLHADLMVRAAKQLARGI